jgi:hypothetical protein
MAIIVVLFIIIYHKFHKSHECAMITLISHWYPHGVPMKQTHGIPGEKKSLRRSASARAACWAARRSRRASSWVIHCLDRDFMGILMGLWWDYNGMIWDYSWIIMGYGIIAIILLVRNVGNGGMGWWLIVIDYSRVPHSLRFAVSHEGFHGRSCDLMGFLITPG